MADKEVLLTPDGLSKLEKELDHLKTVKRREVAARIKQALEFGDISENSEYDDAKKRTSLRGGPDCHARKDAAQCPGHRPG